MLTWTGVWVEDSNATFACAMLKEALFRAIVGCASQTRQINQKWHFANRIDGGLRREVQVEGHLATDRRGIVRELQELSSERGNCSFCRDRHFLGLKAATSSRNRKKISIREASR